MCIRDRFKASDNAEIHFTLEPMPALVTSSSHDEKMCPCQVCAKLSSRRCGFCGIVTYCEPRCQKRDWHTHQHGCTRRFVALTAGGKEYEIDVAARETISGMECLINNKLKEEHREGQRMVVDTIHLLDGVIPAGATKMKDLVKASDNAQIHFTLDTMPALVASSSDDDDLGGALVTSSSDDDAST